MSRTEVLCWDWRQQPDLDELGRAIREVSGGRAHLHQVNTGGDEYAIVLADRMLTADKAQAVYRANWEGQG